MSKKSCIFAEKMKINIDSVRDIVYGGQPLRVDDATKQGIAESYAFLKRFASDKIIYGINTGFGPMAQWRVEDDHLRELQYNIIRSHATGMGEPLCDFFVRASMLARVGSFAQGNWWHYSLSSSTAASARIFPNMAAWARPAIWFNWHIWHFV